MIPISFLPAIIECNQTKDMKSVLDVVKKFPEINAVNLLYLCLFWYRISTYSSVNKMTVSNLCTRVCPSLIHVDDNRQFLSIVSPTYPFVNQLILATKQLDLASYGIFLPDSLLCNKHYVTQLKQPASRGHKLQP